MTVQVVRWCGVIGCVIVSGWETDDSLLTVREYTRSLDLHVQFSADGYNLNILEVNYHIVVKCLMEDQ